jgi:hypothetical protein
MRKSERIILRNKNGVETKKRYKRDKNETKWRQNGDEMETVGILFLRQLSDSLN